MASMCWSKVGGFDLLGMTGVMLGAASCGLPVVLDGFLSYAAALAACQIAPEVKPYLIPVPLFGGEGGAYRVGAPGLEPYLNMGMRVWEKAAARGAGDADRRGGLRDVPSHGHAGGKQYCVTEGVSRRWGRQWPFRFRQRFCRRQKQKNTLEGVCNVGCGGRI